MPRPKTEAGRVECVHCSCQTTCPLPRTRRTEARGCSWAEYLEHLPSVIAEGVYQAGDPR